MVLAPSALRARPVLRSHGDNHAEQQRRAIHVSSILNVGTWFGKGTASAVPLELTNDQALALWSEAIARFNVQCVFSIEPASRPARRQETHPTAAPYPIPAPTYFGRTGTGTSRSCNGACDLAARAQWPIDIARQCRRDFPENSPPAC